MKTCTICRTEKSLAEFNKRARSKDGYSHECKICNRAMKARWKANNAEKYLESKRAEGRKYRANNAEKAKQARDKFLAKNPQYREYFSKWWRDNRDVACAYASKRRAARIQATPAWMNEEKVAEFYFAADFLGMVTGEWHEVDHIVPLQSLVVCGLHWEGNLQVLTREQNRSKSNHLSR